MWRFKFNTHLQEQLQELTEYNGHLKYFVATFKEEAFYLMDLYETEKKTTAALRAEVESLTKEREEAKNQSCPTCIARRGIDRCRPDEAFHVTHYTAEEMDMDPLPVKPCECGIVPAEVVRG